MNVSSIWGLWYRVEVSCVSHISEKYDSEGDMHVCRYNTRSHTFFESEWGRSESPKQSAHWNVICVPSFQRIMTPDCYRYSTGGANALCNKARYSHSCVILHAVITSLMLCCCLRWRGLHTDSVEPSESGLTHYHSAEADLQHRSTRLRQCGRTERASSAASVTPPQFGLTRLHSVSMSKAVCRHLLVIQLNRYAVVVTGNFIYSVSVFSWYLFFFLTAQQLLEVQDFLIIEATRSYSDTPHSTGLLWKSDQPDADMCTRQKKT